MVSLCIFKRRIPSHWNLLRVPCKQVPAHLQSILFGFSKSNKAENGQKQSAPTKYQHTPRAAAISWSLFLCERQQSNSFHDVRSDNWRQLRLFFFISSFILFGRGGTGSMPPPPGGKEHYIHWRLQHPSTIYVVGYQAYYSFVFSSLVCLFCLFLYILSWIMKINTRFLKIMKEKLLTQKANLNFKKYKKE